jgi:hypothetical protein
LASSPSAASGIGSGTSASSRTTTRAPAGAGLPTAADAAKAWEIASRRIAEVTTASAEGVRDIPDSRHGRHFADDVAGELARGDTLKVAIDTAITRWMGWRIRRPRPPRCRSARRTARRAARADD